MPISKTVFPAAAICLLAFLLTSCTPSFSFFESSGKPVRETIYETQPETIPETRIETLSETLPAASPETLPETQWIPHPETGLPETRRDETDPPATETEIPVIPVIAPGEGVLLPVAHIAQTDDLPNACESIAAVMLASYYDFSLSPEEFIDDYLPCGELYCDKLNGIWYGPDPTVAYGGDPRSPDKGFGCYAAVIERAMNRFLPDTHRAQTIYGLTLSDLTSYLDEGIPVEVWVTLNMEPVLYDIRWCSYDGAHHYLYPTTEHCMVLVGYDSKQYYFMDSLADAAPVAYPKGIAEYAFWQLGSQALIINEE